MFVRGRARVAAHVWSMVMQEAIPFGYKHLWKAVNTSRQMLRDGPGTARPGKPGTPQRLGLGPAKLVAKHPAPGAVDKSNRDSVLTNHDHTLNLSARNPLILTDTTHKQTHTHTRTQTENHGRPSPRDPRPRPRAPFPLFPRPPRPQAFREQQQRSATPARPRSRRASGRLLQD